MTELEIILYLSGGIVMLFIGAEGLIRGSSNLALKIGISPLVVGLTVVAFATSAPELFVSLRVALMGNASISLGNVIGSNIANIALVLGFASFIRPLNVQVNVVKREIPVMIGVNILLILLFLDGGLDVIDGVIFVTSLIVYNVFTVIIARKEKNPKIDSKYEEVLVRKFGKTISIALIIVGLSFLIIGSNFFVQSAVAIAKLFNISDVVIGLTVVAMGTSLPELIISVVASFKKESDIIVGNVIGSNIFNILAILGITALIIPINSVDISYIDLGVMLFTAIILLPLSKSGLVITRLEGTLLLLGYIGYIYYLVPK
jgi:cation:H+ antiporter